MKQKMDEFEESLNFISISNSITELKHKIQQLEFKYKYSLAQNDISSDGRINNGNEESKRIQNRPNSIIRNNTRSLQAKASNTKGLQVKVSNPILHQNMDNSIDLSDQSL